MDETDQDADGSEIITAFQQQIETLDTVEFTRLTETEYDSETTTTTERVSANLEASEKRVEIVESEWRDDVTTIVNESHSVTYNADENTVTERRYYFDQLLPTIESLKNESLVSYDYRGTDTVEGQDVHVLAANIAEQTEANIEFDLTVYVGTDTDFPVQIVVKNQADVSSGYTQTVTFEDVTLNEGIPDSTFELAVPDDATDPSEVGPDISRYDDHDRLQSSADLSVPDAELSDGYAFDHSRIVDGDGYYTVSATYTDGTNQVTVSTRGESSVSYDEREDYNEISIGGSTGWYAEYDDTGLLHWDANDQSYSIYGQVSEEEMLALATAIAEG
jgi:outer membrane lipoprotein-sorting protein